MKQILIGMAILSILTACGTTTHQAAPIEERNNTAVQPNENWLNPSSQPINELTDGKQQLAERSVYFDFDSFVVKPEYRQMLEAHTTYLSKNVQKSIIIQGNTDDRGTTEYNLALGQKRAEAVRKVLNILGVSDNQIETISFGKERPKMKGNHEAAWEENRRADIVYRGEDK